ncbi:diguanylate cyclase [Thiomicrorhabdus chilensis]|uniref:diguanylate cyclase n=1 Tax=Thiomicrorhabdus chilensis TaxID=63656 RepID=UPI00042498B4|nr:diguanylate cyclase [Thiomicrorhabdus chilensis]
MPKPFIAIPNNSIILIAFFLTLTLVSVLLLTADRITQTTLDSTAEVTETQYQKLHNLINLHIAGQKRTVDLEQVLLHEDPFEQDQALLNFYANGVSYAKYRDQLAPLVANNEFERAWFMEITAMASKVGPTQDKVAELAINDEVDAAKKLMFSGLIDDLNTFNQKVKEFSLYQSTEIQNAINQARLKIDQLMQTFVIVAALLIGSSMVFSIMMARRFSNINQRLMQTNDSLEREVQSRTHELIKTQESLLQRNSMLEKLSTTDPLTQLCNRLKVERFLEEQQETFTKNQATYCALLIDLDNFKNINDTFGHHTGDKVLQAFSNLLQQHFKYKCRIGRWGGEEFIVILEDCELEKAEEQAENFRKQVEAFDFPRIGQVTLSAGLACIEAAESTSELIHRADNALYESKHAGRNRITTSKTFTPKTQHRLALGEPGQ